MDFGKRRISELKSGLLDKAGEADGGAEKEERRLSKVGAR